MFNTLFIYDIITLYIINKKGDNMKKKIFKIATYACLLLLMFTINTTVYAKCADYKADNCDKQTENGYKCEYKKGGCKKSNKKVEEKPVDPKEPDKPEEEKASCQRYNAKGEKECESHTEDGYICEYKSYQKGFQCRKGKKVSKEKQEEVKKEVTSCRDINDQGMCRNSNVKTPGQQYAYKCRWTQNGCANGALAKGIEETIIAGDDDQRKEEIDDYKDRHKEKKKTETSYWNTEGGETNKFLKKVWGMLKVIVPVLVVILSIADFLKTLIVSDEKNYKEGFIRFLKRIGVAIILFVLPAIIKLLLDLAGMSGVGIFEVFS